MCEALGQMFELQSSSATFHGELAKFRGRQYHQEMCSHFANSGHFFSHRSRRSLSSSKVSGQFAEDQVQFQANCVIVSDHSLRLLVLASRLSPGIVLLHFVNSVKNHVLRPLKETNACRPYSESSQNCASTTKPTIALSALPLFASFHKATQKGLSNCSALPLFASFHKAALIFAYELLHRLATVRANALQCWQSNS
jgi:hypothetical protein